MTTEVLFSGGKEKKSFQKLIFPVLWIEIGFFSTEKINRRDLRYEMRLMLEEKLTGK